MNNTSHATTVTFNAKQTNPTHFTGFGAMIWTGAQGTTLLTLQELFQLPGFRIARINHEIRNVPIPNNATFEQYQALWETNGDNATDLQFPESLGGTYLPINYLFLATVPCSFIHSTGYGNICPVNCSKGCSLIEDVNLQSLADYIASGVQDFNKKYAALTSCPGGTAGCYKANYVELSNRPNSTSTVEFTTDQYSTLLEKVSKQLKTISPTTLITGPGVGRIDWNTSTGTDIFVTGLTATGVQDLGVWSVQDYVYATVNGIPYENIDAGISINGYGQTAARFFFPQWYSKPQSLSPLKPVIISEVGTKATGFHGVEYTAPTSDPLYSCLNPPLSNSNCTIVSTTAYGVRLYTYLISLMAGGANAALYFEAMDQSFENPTESGLGLFDLNLNKRTIYTALRPLFEFINSGSTVLVSPTTQNGNDIYGLTFLSPPNPNGTVNCLTIALANGTGSLTPITRTTIINNLPTSAQSFTATALLFNQSGTTVFEGQLIEDPFSSFTFSNGTLTHTTTMANDTAVTVKVCLVY